MNDATRTRHKMLQPRFTSIRQSSRQTYAASTRTQPANQTSPSQNRTTISWPIAELPGLKHTLLHQ
jgi:hypothetical protein